MADVVILVPVLGRGWHIKPLVDSLYDTTDRARFCFIMRPGDHSAEAEVDKTKEQKLMLPASRTSRGDYAKKINAGYLNTTEPLIFMGATDIRFHEGWLEAIQSKLVDNVQAVGTNDLCNLDVMAGKHSTHTMVTREYVDKYGTIDEPNKILHEGYWHEFVDNEFIATARYHDAWGMALDSIVEHMHPVASKGSWDDSYLASRDRVQFGMDIWDERKSLWTRR